MKTLLVPIDFTATSDNAVNFAIEWSKRYEYERIILLKTFYDSLFENLVLSDGYYNVNEEYINRQRSEAKDQLNQLCHHVAQQIAHVKVMTAVSEEPLLRAIMDVIREEHPELVVVGTDNYSYSSDSFVAGNAINIAKISPVRVLIVPAVCKYRPVKQVLLPYNIDMINELDRLRRLRNLPLWGDIELLVLNIDPQEKLDKTSQKFIDGKEKFENLLKNFKYDMYYSPERKLIKSITSFNEKHDTQLIIALPGRHSFLYSVTHTNITEAIYKNAYQPVLILK